MTPCSQEGPRRVSPLFFRSSAALVFALGMHLAAKAQKAPPTPETPAVQAQAPAARQEQAAPPVNASTAARFIESCNDALQRGVVAPGCQAPIYRNELERLKQEAITTQNPNLLSFVGDAYRNPRSGFADMSQAYRWYLMAAVRGDPQAMQRLAEMNRAGSGVPKDNVKAMGYARLVQRMSSAGTQKKANVVSIINELGDEMAVEELALAERFAAQLEAQILRPHHSQGDSASSSSAPTVLPVKPDSHLPGMPQAAPTQAPATVPAIPGTVMPGVPSLGGK